MPKEVIVECIDEHCCLCANVCPVSQGVCDCCGTSISDDNLRWDEYFDFLKNAHKDPVDTEHKDGFPF